MLAEFGRAGVDRRADASFKRALEEPIRQIVVNPGVEGAVIVMATGEKSGKSPGVNLKFEPKRTDHLHHRGELGVPLG